MHAKRVDLMKESKRKILAFERNCANRVVSEDNKRGNLGKDAAKKRLLQEVIER